MPAAAIPIAAAAISSAGVGFAVSASVGVLGAIGIGAGLFAVQVGASFLTSGAAPSGGGLARRDFASQASQRLSMQVAAAVPQRKVIGFVRVSGSPIHAERFSINGRILVLILPISRGPVAAMGTVYLDDIAIRSEQITVEGEPITGGPFQGHVRILKVLGGQTTANPYLQSWLSDWRASDIGEDTSFLVVAMDVGRPAFHTTHIPKVSVDVRGGLFEDTRVGQTLWTDNAIVVSRGWCKDPVFGPGGGAGQVDEDLAEAQANICDESVALPAPSAAATVASDAITAASADITVKIGDFVAGDSGPSGLWDGYVSTIDDSVAGTLVFTLADTIEAAASGAVKTLPAGAATVTRSATYDVTVAADRITGPGDYLRVTIGQRVAQEGAGFVGYVSDIVVNGFGDPNRHCVFTLAADLAAARAGTAMTLPAGATRITVTHEPRYTLNGTIEADQTRAEVKERLEQAMAGRIIPAGGRWLLRCGAYAAPTVVLDERDIVSPMKVATAPPHAASFNRGQGRYAGPAVNGQPLSYPTYEDAAALAEDQGEKRTLERDLWFTNSPTMAARLMRIAVRRSRKPVTIEAEYFMTAFRLQAGDFVFKSNARWQWSNLPCEVEAWDLFTRKRGGGLTQVIAMTLRESGADVYEDAGDEALPAPPGPGVIPDVVPEDVPFFTVQQNGDALVFVWDAVTDTFEQLDGYDIARGLVGGDSALATPVTQTTKGTTITTKVVPALVEQSGDPVVQRFWIWARNRNGVRSAVPRAFDLAVKPVDFDAKLELPQAPRWKDATIEGYTRFWDGRLVTKSATVSGDSSVPTLFSFVPNPVASSSVELAEFDIGHDAADLRVSAEIDADTLAGAPAPRFKLDYRTEAGSYGGFMDWGIGEIGAARRFKFRLERDNALNGPTVIRDFVPKIDARERTLDFGTVSIAAAGEVFVFDPPFFEAPLPAITPEGPYLPEQVAVSATQATIRLRDPEAAAYVTAPARVQFIGG